MSNNVLRYDAVSSKSTFSVKFWLNIATPGGLRVKLPAVFIYSLLLSSRTKVSERNANKQMRFRDLTRFMELVVDSKHLHFCIESSISGEH